MPWVGQGLDPPGSSGVDEEHAHKICKLFGWSISNTHLQNLHPDSRVGTFMAAKALDYVRCDYFLTSFSVCAEPEPFAVDDTFNKLAKSDDRLPIRISLTMPALARHTIVKKEKDKLFTNRGAAGCEAWTSVQDSQMHPYGAKIICNSKAACHA